MPGVNEFDQSEKNKETQEAPAKQGIEHAVSKSDHAWTGKNQPDLATATKPVGKGADHLVATNPFEKPTQTEKQGEKQTQGPAQAGDGMKAAVAMQGFLDKLKAPENAKISQDEFSKLFERMKMGEHTGVKLPDKDAETFKQKMEEAVKGKPDVQKMVEQAFGPKHAFDEKSQTATVLHGIGKGKETVHMGADGKPDEVHMADGQTWKKHVNPKTGKPDGTWDRWKPGQDPKTDKPYNSKMDVEYGKDTGVLSWTNHVKKDGKDVQEHRATGPGRYYADTDKEGPPKAEEKPADGKTEGGKAEGDKKDDGKKDDVQAKESEVIDKAAKDHKLTDAQKQQVLEGIHAVKEGGADKLKALGKMDENTLAAIKDVLTSPPNHYKMSVESTTKYMGDPKDPAVPKETHTEIVIAPSGATDGIRIRHDGNSSQGTDKNTVEAVKVDTRDGLKVTGEGSEDPKKVEENLKKLHEAGKKAEAPAQAEPTAEQKQEAHAAILEELHKANSNFKIGKDSTGNPIFHGDKEQQEKLHSDISSYQNKDLAPDEANLVKLMMFAGVENDPKVFDTVKNLADKLKISPERLRQLAQGARNYLNEHDAHTNMAEFNTFMRKIGGAQERSLQEPQAPKIDEKIWRNVDKR